MYEEESTLARDVRDWYTYHNKCVLSFVEIGHRTLAQSRLICTEPFSIHVELKRDFLAQYLDHMVLVDTRVSLNDMYRLLAVHCNPKQAMPLSMSPAAVCQCFTLVSLCTSIADPNWIQVSNSSDPSGKKLIYGVAFTLHASQNLTDTGPLGGVNGWGMWLLYTLAAVCYGAVLFSSSSFLLDFLGSSLDHPRLVTFLYVTTVVLSLSILGVCGACQVVIYRNLQRGRLWSWTGLSSSPSSPAPGPALGAKAAGLHPYPGESFYIALLGLLFSCLAAGVNIRNLQQLVPQRGDFTAGQEEEEDWGGEEQAGEEEEEGGDEDTELLTPRRPTEDSGVVFS